MSEEEVRQLKAIMFTDIKGFSSMMGVDEERTVRLVREHRETVREMLAKHHGTERQTIGDAFMVLFDSAVNAVKCAVEIQNRLHEKNSALPETERVWLRIGIHLGDIIIDEKEIYGDGVNIAARVEPQAEPGGICITQQVFHQIEGKLDCRVIHIGQRELKNIRNAPDLYNIILDHAGETSASPSLAPGHAQVVGKDAAWPRQPWWKHVVWWLVYALLAAILLSLFRALGGWRTASGDSDLFRIVFTAASLIGILAVFFFGYRFWAKGRFTVWLHGKLFVIIPAVSALVFAYSYVTLQGRIEAALLPVKSCTAITSRLAEQIQEPLAEAITGYATAFGLNAVLVWMLTLSALLGYVFFPRRVGTPMFPSRYWLVLVAGIAVLVAAELAFRVEFFCFGPMRFALYLAWMLIAAAIITSAREPSAQWSNGPRALITGLVMAAALFCVMAGGGFLKIFAYVNGLTPDMKPLVWQDGMSEIDVSQRYVGVTLLVAAVALVVLLRKGLTWSKGMTRTARWGEIAAGAVAISLTALPLGTLTRVSADTLEALLLPARGMQPAALTAGGEASFYINRSPATLGFYGARVCMAITEKGPDECEEEGAVLASLSGGKECKAMIAASLGDPGKKKLGPALCLTAIEAKIACEVQGKRLASPEEWDAAVGGLKPIDPAAKADPAAPITRLPIGEWAMRMVHGNPVFEIKGADAAADIPRTLAPTAFSPKVGFRCAYRYEE